VQASQQVVQTVQRVKATVTLPSATSQATKNTIVVANAGQTAQVIIFS